MTVFDKIAGQDNVVEILKSQINNKKTSHAYLFEGSSGCGKLACAKEFAKALFNDEKFYDAINNNTHPDVKILSPDGVQSYLAKQIKDLVSDSGLAPIQAIHKVYIIKDADKLGMAGANAFLKTLEEPAPHTCFVLLANNKDNVLPTILSRCQILSFNQLPYDNALNYVKDNSNLNMADAKKALDLFGGNTGKAIEFCNNQNLQDLADEVINLIENLQSLSDWQTIIRSQDIFHKIQEIVDVRKNDLDTQIKDLIDVLESPALSLVEEQNKRALTNLQKELLFLICSCIKLYYRNQMTDSQSTTTQILKINALDEIEDNLKYNISAQNFCDVVFLRLKRI